MNKYALSMQIIRSIREKTDTAVLYYSAGGKDGIALLDMLAGVFNKVICYYMYLIPDLDHVQPYIRWAENHYKNVEVCQIEHFQRDYYISCGFFREPDNSVKPRKIGEIEQAVREETGIKYGFSGMKGVDGYMKRMRLKKFAKSGYITDKGMVYPLALWTNKEVLQYIRQRGLIQPFIYDSNAISQGFTIDLTTMLLMRSKYPNDYKRILEEFPYSEKLIFDYEREQNNSTGK
jgi:sulfate adenylyltransferase subunit 2